MIPRTSLLLSLVTAIMPCVAQAETPLFTMRFGKDALDVHAADLKTVEATLDYGGWPALSIVLDPRFDVMMAELTSRHIGEPGAFLVCGSIVSEPVMQSEIPTASLIITGLAPDEVSRLTALLKEGTCDEVPTN